MNYSKLDEKAIQSWRIARGIPLICVCIFIVTQIILSELLDYPSVVSLIIFGVSGALTLLMILNFFIYPPIEYRQWKYMVNEDRIEIIHGIFFINKTVIPVIRIQNITLSQGPINRKLGLYKLTISIASDSFDIPCLDKKIADEISMNLKDKIYTRLKAKGVN